MKLKGIVGGLLLLLLAACQPQVLEVEVTRLVESSPGAVATAVSPSSALVSTPEPQIVEVTRLVTEAVVQEIPIEVTKAPLGTAERPVQLLFPPDAGTAVINLRSQPLIAALQEATGLEFAVGIADNEQALIDLLCTAPADTIGFFSPMEYVRANEQCGAQLGSVAVNAEGFTWTAGMIVARRDRGPLQLADLDGLRGAVPDPASLPNAKAVETMLLQAGAEPAEIVAVQGDNAAMLAVFNGEVDFAVGTFTPPIMPEGEDPWQYGVDQNEIWRYLGLVPERSPIGYVLVIAEPEFGGYRIRDARSGVFDIQPEIFNATRIIALTPQIPNDTLAFGRDFPLGLARQVMSTLQTFTASEACADSLCSSDFYNWRGLEPADEAFYQPLFDIAESGVMDE
jgi:phosphonate transport system substrate-binding protein